MPTEAHPHLATLNQFFQAYAQRDFDGLRQVLAADARWTALGQHPLAGVKNGFDEVIQFFDQMGAVMGRSNPRVEKLIVSANETYVIECQRVITNRTDGYNLDHLVCVLWRFENSKIVEGRHFFSDSQAVDSFLNAVAQIK